MKKNKTILTLVMIICLIACFCVTGCGTASEAGETTPPDDGTVNEAGEGTASAPDGEADAAPEIEGLTFESEADIEYAEQFKIYRYEGGYKYFRIPEGEDFLLIPEGGEAPENLPEDLKLLQAPVKNIYLAATSQMALFFSMGGEDSVRMTSLKQDGWTFDSVKNAMKEGRIVFAGKYSEPDYEMLLDENCGLVIESTMISHSPEIKEMLEDLGIPVIVDRSSYESSPMGRMEWIKFYSEIIGREDEANAFFNEQKAKLDELKDFENTEKTVAFFYISTDGKAMVRNSKDYIPAMIDMAGARYVFKDADEEGKSTIPMTIEAFYDIASDADYIIYNASIDSSVNSVEDLIAKDPIMSEMKAVKNGNCWSTGGSMYQRTDIVGDMVMDFHTLFTEEDPEGKLEFLSKL